MLKIPTLAQRATCCLRGSCGPAKMLRSYVRRLRKLFRCIHCLHKHYPPLKGCVKIRTSKAKASWSCLYNIMKDKDHFEDGVVEVSCRYRSFSAGHPDHIDSLKVQNEYLASSTLAVPDSVEISKTKQMCIGRKKFNIDPKKGLEYLLENSLLTNTPTDIAEFLLKGEGLNKSMIGQYLCEYHEFNQEVLREFISQQDFKELMLLQALRQFLCCFHPVGEYQKIERVLRGFAKHYCDVNPSTFEDANTCFNLAESIILLNTIMHNPSIKKKLTKEMFAEMVSEEGVISSGQLESIYESIKNDPLKKDDGDDLMHTFFNPDREGWLLKQGGRYKSWKRRWFILTDRCLYYFEFTTDKVPRGIIPLENIKIRDVKDRRMPNCFELFSESSDIVKACKTISNGKMVEGKHHVYRISAVSPQVKKEWMEAIRKSTMYSPFYDLLSKDKNKSK